jgi:hypothetical protein
MPMWHVTIEHVSCGTHTIDVHGFDFFVVTEAMERLRYALSTNQANVLRFYRTFIV